MAKVIPKKREKVFSPAVAFMCSDGAYDNICVPGYTTLDNCPEVMTAVRKISETIAMITLHIMENTEQGDKRIINELSRKIDIEPCSYMTRSVWMTSVVNNLLLYGNGNSVVLPHTSRGLLDELEVIPPSKVSLYETESSYYALINGKTFYPDEILHFVHNPDPLHPWKGRGVKVSLKDVTTNLRQAAHTEKKFMESPKPSIIVKVDAMTDEFASKEGRARLTDDWFDSSAEGRPWFIPAEQFEIEQIKPMTLSDLAIADNVKLNKEAVASILGVPPFLLGVGDYKKEAWNNFVNSTVKSICIGLQQEMTKKLILSPKWYIKFNITSLFDWDIQQIANVFGSLSDRGFVTGNEVRDKLGMSPMKDLDELRILENYIPYNMSGKQDKLIQGGEDDG